MVDPITIVGGGLAVLGSKEVLNKLLGPTADYLGSEAKGLVEKCNINLNNVFTRAKIKLGERIETPGVVNPRVLRYVVEDARFCEDNIIADYYAGILAGSREPSGKEDQSLPYLSMLKEMSSYQVRLHFSFYFELLRQYKQFNRNLGVAADCGKASLILPHEFLFYVFPQDKIQSNYWNLLSHSVVGLYRQGLIGNYFYGELEENIKLQYKDAPNSGAVLTPTFTGAELFMWSLGIESPSAHQFFNIDISTILKIVDFPELSIIKTST